MRHILRIIALVAASLIAQSAEAAQLDADGQIAEKVNSYIKSIDLAHTDLAASVWATTPEVSFIHPRGHERGWRQVVENFYGKTMGETFSKRTLKIVGSPAIHVYGDSAIVEFDWDFVAIRRDTGGELHTTGRETQVYENLPQTGWRLVHVHYSPPPLTGVGEGF